VLSAGIIAPLFIASFTQFTKESNKVLDSHRTGGTGVGIGRKVNPNGSTIFTGLLSA
jgi:hypothetical protein